MKVFEHFKSAGYEGAASYGTHLSTFANTNRDIIVNRISKRLDCLIAGESFETIDERPVSATYMDKKDEGKGDEKSDADADAKAKSDDKAEAGAKAEKEPAAAAAKS